MQFKQTYINTIPSRQTQPRQSLSHVFSVSGRKSEDIENPARIDTSIYKTRIDYQNVAEKRTFATISHRSAHNSTCYV